MKKGSQLELLTLLSTVVGTRWDEAEERKLSWRNLAHIDAIAIQLPPGFTNCLLSTKAGPAAFYPLKSVAVVSSLHRMSLLPSTGLSKKTQHLTIMFLQEKVHVASNWIWESSCSA